MTRRQPLFGNRSADVWKYILFLQYVHCLSLVFSKQQHQLLTSAVFIHTFANNRKDFHHSGWWCWRKRGRCACEHLALQREFCSYGLVKLDELVGRLQTRFFSFLLRCLIDWLIYYFYPNWFLAAGISLSLINSSERCKKNVVMLSTMSN